LKKPTNLNPENLKAISRVIPGKQKPSGTDVPEGVILLQALTCCNVNSQVPGRIYPEVEGGNIPEKRENGVFILHNPSLTGT